MPAVRQKLHLSSCADFRDQLSRRKAADHRARTELGAAMELVKIGEVATIEYLEKELAILDRLNGMIARAFKSLLYVRGIKSMSSSGAVAPSQPRLSKAA